jgi:hypothetical protein
MHEFRSGRTSRVKGALMLEMAPALLMAAALTKYRPFQLGTDLTKLSTQTGVDTARVRISHSHPALIQELESSGPAIEVLKPSGAPSKTCP